MNPTKHVIARAPSNIALIKYMGKTDSSLNLPANPSLSLTLDRLATVVELRRTHEPESSGTKLRFMPGLPALPKALSTGWETPILTDSAHGRLMRHFERVRAAAPGVLERHALKSDVAGVYEFRSANSFPASAGIASSASSFAAFTLAGATAFSQDPRAFARTYESNPSLRRELAMLSRQGSGSSCRSFEGPWVGWEGEKASRVYGTHLPKLTNLVVVVSAESKDISSSEAHARVVSSPLWHGRPERVEKRYLALKSALVTGDRRAVAKIAWEEMWEMHSLFHTAQERFSYWLPGTIAILNALEPEIVSERPPIVTLDAGPNPHILVPTAEADAWISRLQTIAPGLPILRDEQGEGASLLEFSAEAQAT